MAPSSPVKIVVVGTGLIGPRHCEAIAATAGAKLSCIVDPSPAARPVAERFQVPLYASVKDMVSSTTADTKPDAALVCTPNHTHVAISTDLLDAGIHVLVEKPISIDVESGKKLIKHAAAKNLRLLVGHHRRFNRYVIATKRLLTSGRLGRIIAINGVWALCKPSSYFDPPTEWRRSAGVIAINLIHDIDILQHLLGPVVRVHAEPAPKQRTHPAEEGAAVVLRFASGAIGTFLLSDALPTPFNFEAGTGENPTIPRTGLDFYRVFGSEGCVSVPDMRVWSYGRSVEKSWLEVITEERDEVEEMRVPFELQAEHLVRVVRGQEDPVCSGVDGLSAVLVSEAVKRSMDSGLPVDIEVLAS